WVKGGSLQGDPATAPASHHNNLIGARQLSRVDLEIKPDNDWVTSGSRDQFRCFVLDPHWTSSQFVNGVNVIAGNPKVVHHAIAFLDPDRASLAKRDPNTGDYECFGS